MANRDRALEPLMFIEQPTERTPQSTMQQTYSSWHAQASTHKKESKENEPSNAIKKKRRRRLNRDIMYNQAAEENVPPKEKIEAESENSVSEQTEDQTFADLTLEEKVVYCTSTSSYIPNIMCTIKTEKQTIVGVIGKYEEGIVHIKPQKSRVFTEIPLEEIISIRMIGF